MVSPGPTGYCGKFVAQIGEREVEARGQLRGFRDGFGHVGEQFLHRSRAISDSAPQLRASSWPAAMTVVLWRTAVSASASSRSSGSGVAHAVGGQQRQLHGARQLHHGLIARFLVAMEVALELRRTRCARPNRRISFSKRARVGGLGDTFAGQAHQALRVSRQLFLGSGGFALWARAASWT